MYVLELRHGGLLRICATHYCRLRRTTITCDTRRAAVSTASSIRGHSTVQATRRWRGCIGGCGVRRIPVRILRRRRSRRGRITWH